MRCSLLALSSYLDAELDAEPTGELEAHLVACDRCRTAMGHLREESARIGGLARIHVPDDAVHDLFMQIGLIAEDDDLPQGPVHRDRPASVEAPPWFGAERGAALPWAPRPAGQDQAQPRELIGERSPATAIAEPPELFLWDETIDQIATAVPAPPPVHVVPDPEPAPVPEVDVEARPFAHLEPEPESFRPPPVVIPAEPQPPDLSTSSAMVAAPQLAAGPNAFQRLRDAVAVRFALRRGAGASLDPGVEIVSGVGAPTWNQRGRPRHWSDSPPVIAAAVPPVAVLPAAVAPAAVTPVAVAPVAVPPVAMPPVAVPPVAMPPVAMPPVAVPPSSPPVVRPRRLSRFMARLTSEPAISEAVDEVEPDDRDSADAFTRHRSAVPDGRDNAPASPMTDRGTEPVAHAAAPARFASHPDTEATAPPELADVLSEVASLAAPLERTPAPVADEPVIVDYLSNKPVREAVRTDFAPTVIPEPEPPGLDEGEDTRFGVSMEPALPVPGRHVRRLHSQKTDRRDWNPTRPVTGRHVLPLGGPAVGAADRDRRLWLFGAVTVVLMLLGLLIGRQVTQTGPLVGATIPRPAPTHHATTPPTAAPLPVATPAPAPTAVIPVSPTPQQLTGSKTLGSGSGGFTVADVRYGEHPNDFRLVFDMAFPDTVTGSPTTVIGYSGPTTLYVEFVGVDGASNIAAMPTGKIVVSVAALPMARNTDRLIFKITLSKNAPFDAYYLSGARLVIDVT